MSRNHPDHDTVRAALALARRAPSIHNTQPWQWRVGDNTVHLYADDSRRVPHADPEGREMLLSCGAALHHLRVAIGALGWDTVVHRFPNPADRRHLAAVEFVPGAGDETVVRLARAISRRRSDRRRFTSWEISPAQVEDVAEAGDASGVRVQVVDSPTDRARLTKAFRDAAAAHAADRAYNAELSAWSGHHAAPQGVPARNAVAAIDPENRPFADPRLPEAVMRDTSEWSRMLLVCTSSNDMEAWLKAGESTSAVLLSATAHGFATCALTEPLELPAIRQRIRDDILHGFGHPQLIVRMGWAATSARVVPATPRLPLDAVVRSLEPADATR